MIIMIQYPISKGTECVLTYKRFVPTILDKTKPNYLLILGLKPLLELMGNKDFTASETILL